MTDLVREWRERYDQEWEAHREESARANRVEAALKRERQSSKDREKSLRETIAALHKALRPFAVAVFNDNGDMSVDRSLPSYDDFCDAYLLHKRFASFGTPPPGP